MIAPKVFAVKNSRQDYRHISHKLGIKS